MKGSAVTEALFRGFSSRLWVVSVGFNTLRHQTPERLTFSANADDPFAKLQLQMLGAITEFERALIRKRQREGIQKAKQKGVYKGRKPSIDRAAVLDRLDAGETPTAIARDMGIARLTVYRIRDERANA